MADDAPTNRCRASLDGQRCSYRGTRDELADHADEAGHPRCVVCTRALNDYERQACTRCVADVRDNLAAIARAFAHSERVIGEAAYHGIAWRLLALFGDGAIQGGGADDHIRYGDPHPAIAVLESHDRDWRKKFRHPHPPYHPLGHPDRETPKQLLGNVLAYLREHHTLAARTHPGFDDYATEVRELRSAVEHAVGMADDPVRAPASCFDCGGQLVRQFAPLTSTSEIAEHDCPACRSRHAGRHGDGDEGLTDDWTCRRCDRVYDQPSYFLALRSRRDECVGWVSVKIAASVLRIPESTLFRWAAAGEVEVRVEEGRRLVEWSEVSTLRERRAS